MADKLTLAWKVKVNDGAENCRYAGFMIYTIS